VTAVRVKMNPKAVPSLLKGGEGVERALRDSSERISNRAGPGMETDYAVGRTRARASVRTASYKAMRAEAKTRDLSRALDAGR